MKRLLLVAGLLASSSAYGQTPWLKVDVQVQAPADGELNVGEPFKIIIEARHPPGGIALLPESLPLPDTLGERTQARRHTRGGDANTEIDRYELELLGFDVGEHTLPALELAFSSTQAQSAPQTIVVLSGLTADEQPIASSTLAQAIGALEQMAAPDPQPRAILIPDYTPLYIVGGLILLLIGLIVARQVTRQMARARRAMHGAAPPPPPRPAADVALERLEALRQSNLLERSEFKAFYIELSEALRSYAGARYAFDSVELTVPELIGALRDLRTPGLDLASFERLLNDADFVKFAKYTPTDTEAHSAINGAFDVVERTRPPQGPGDATKAEDLGNAA